MRFARLAALTVLALTLLAGPPAIEAQQAPKAYRIGYLAFRGTATLDNDFREGLRDLGWVAGQNLVIEYRSAGNNVQRVRPLAEEFVRLGVDLIVSTTGRSTLVVRDVTRSVPIVMTVSGDAVSQGLVASLAKPGGNITGLTLASPETTSKRLQLLREALPQLSRVSFLGCLEGPVGRRELTEVHTAAPALGLQVHAVDVASAGGLGPAFKAVSGQRPQALLIGDCPTDLPPQQVRDLALQYRLPTMGLTSDMARSGALMMAYGPSVREAFRRAATYVDKILKGAKPADLPIEQPTKFELVINLKTAKALGLTIPPSLLQRADEIIQ
jgi:putative tryptophan/tyrosine transport system substrate-binding protein